MGYSTIKRQLRVLERQNKTREDEIGRRYGQLVIQNVTFDSGRSYADCLCDCGGQKRIQLSNVKTGNTTSCGCHSKEQRFTKAKKMRDSYSSTRLLRNQKFIGQKYNNLTITNISGFEENHTIAECDCDCGNTTVTRLNALKTGNVKSCGCLQSMGTQKANEAMAEFRVDGTNLKKLTNTPNKNNKSSGVRNVYWDAGEGKWRVLITLQGKRHDLGRFFSIEEANEVAQRYRDENFTPIKEKYEMERR